ITGGSIQHTGGWGILLNGNTYIVLFGGVGGFGTAVADQNEWGDLGLGRNKGNNYLYVNGGVSDTDPTSGPAPPYGNFALATTPQSPGNGNFTGLIDEVRVFNFSPGQFNVSDLLYSSSSGAPPIPVTSAASGLTSNSAVLNGTVNPNGT